MTSRPLVIFGILLIIAAIVGATIYSFNMPANIDLGGGGAGSATSTAALASTTVATNAATTGTLYNQAPSDMNDQSNAGSASSSLTFSIPLPASTTADTSDWRIFVTNDQSYSIEYPPDLSPSPATDGVSSVSFALPAATYFHWPLLDTASIIVNASAQGAACPALGIPADSTQPPVPITISGYSFSRIVGADASAKTRSIVVMYQTQSSGRCYQISLHDSGAVSAASSVNDASLIAQYNSQRDTDVAAALSILNAMVANFHILAPAR